MKMDETTGLPELPEGYFFRVHKQSSYSKYHYVTMFRKKQKRFLFWTYTRNVELIFNDMIHPTLTKENVRQAAINCTRQWERWKSSDGSLVGDYPPKSLRDVPGDD